MLDAISISNYKSISSLQICNLSNVNYLVGKNGCGKSSILENILLLKFASTDWESVLKQYFNDFKSEYKIHFVPKNLPKDYSTETKESIYNLFYTRILKKYQVSFSYRKNGYFLDVENIFNLENTENVLKMEFNNTGVDVLQFAGNIPLIHQFKIKYFTFLPTKNKGLSPENFKEISTVFDYITDSENKSICNFLNEVLKIPAYFVTNDSIILHQQKKVHINFFKSLIEFKDFDIICVEEPETALHPDLHRFLPKLFEEFSKNNNVQFIISTHSPFIISESAVMSDRQNVYLFDNATLVDKNGKKSFHLGFDSNAWNGYNGNEANMLGAKGTDLGYPENFCILEESSLGTILKAAAEKSIIKNWNFISSKGNSAVYNMAENIKEFSKNLNDQAILLFTNPFYKDKFYIILDSMNDLELKNKTLVGQFKYLEKNLEERFIKLEETQIEKYYKNIDPKLSDNFEKEINLEVDKNKHNAIKAKYAIQVSKLITDKNIFTKLFNNELKTLLL
jgi:AAA15 family ATPase/GTPase